MVHCIVYIPPFLTNKEFKAKCISKTVCTKESCCCMKSRLWYSSPFYSARVADRLMFALMICCCMPSDGVPARDCGRPVVNIMRMNTECFWHARTEWEMDWVYLLALIHTWWHFRYSHSWADFSTCCLTSWGAVVGECSSLPPAF